MKLLLKNYKFSAILLSFVMLGGAIGLFLGPKASCLEPFGNLFLNLMFMIITPLVFFSISSAIANMNGIKRLGKIIGNIFMVFICTAAIAAFVGIIGAIIVNPTKGINLADIQGLMAKTNNNKTEQVTLLQQVVNTFTVSDFTLLLSKKNMLPLIVFSLIFGISTVLCGDKAEYIKKFLNSGTVVTTKMVNIVMYYAPIGLGCYFASITGQLGTQILRGYLRVFVLYVVLALIYYFVFFTIYAYISGGKDKVKIYWSNVLTPSITALATCSSAATIPVNLEYTKKMGVPEDIAETVIPLGANIHKDGSVIGGVMKIAFLFGIFGKDMTSLSSIISILFVAFLVGAVMAAIPGGGLIAETLILSIYGFPLEALPIIAVISTIIDAPATLLNSTGNTVCSMLIARVIEGKDWCKNKVS